jgi:hypothetical protein
MTNVHGREYRSRAEMVARFNELGRLNAEIGASDGRVTEQDALKDAIREVVAAERATAQRPYYIYWRSLDGRRKGRRTFRSRREQVRFIWDTPHAVTFYN